ncbi:hypothetical protein LUZ60_017414 [Juncus effusus]|nr:hypothetical protein LUZ60_017414 [Juncus effusus]
MELSGPRWKGKDFSNLAKSNPISQIITQLKSSLSSSKTTVVFDGTNFYLKTLPFQTYLLNCASFGREIFKTSEKDEQHFVFDSEETFYLFHELKCINVISRENRTQISEGELWNHMRSKNELFPVFYKAYSHLRNKNWVVKSGHNYQVDFVAYRHHPALVHAEYGVVVDLERERGERKWGRIRNLDDLGGLIRICNGVAKTILVLGIWGFDENDLGCLNCLEKMIVDERTITRWVASQSRELCEINENDDEL